MRYVFTFILLFLAYILTAQSIYSLQKTLQQAKKNNPLLKLEYFNIDVAEAEIISAKLRPNPIFNNQSMQLLDANYFPLNTSWANNKNRQVWLQLTKPFVLPEQRKNKITLAKHQYTIAQKQYLEIERKQLYEVGQKWLAVWAAKKYLDLLMLAKANADSLVDFNKQKSKTKSVSPIELSKTEIMAGQLALKVNDAQQSYRNELLSLKFSLGTQEAIDIDTSALFEHTPIFDQESLLKLASTTRGDILVWNSVIDHANSNVSLQRSLAWPTPELGVIYNPQNSIPYVGFFGTLQIPIFSRNQGEMKRSRVLQLKSQQGLQYALTQLQTELAIAYNSFQSQKNNILLLKKLVNHANQLLYETKAAYLKGENSITDLSDTQFDWLSILQQYYEEEHKLRKSYIDLIFSCGLINKLAE